MAVYQAGEERGFWKLLGFPGNPLGNGQLLFRDDLPDSVLFDYHRHVLPGRASASIEKPVCLEHSDRRL
jgi:hypothetical protein